MSWPTEGQVLASRGEVSDQQEGYGTLSFEFGPSAIQNGAPDGMALVDASGAVLELLSYEGSLLATDGPAAGQARSHSVHLLSAPTP